jgi:hypothetical protein
MRRTLMSLAAILTGLLVAGCGSSGHSADPPASVVALAGDGIVTVSWPTTSGVDYWMFFANANSISTSNWTNIPGSRSAINVGSPFVATGLANDAVYSFTINGRTNGGPGGEGSPSVSAIPRLAGTATATLPEPWTAPAPSTVPVASELRGVTWGTILVAVGAGGVMYASLDGVTWTAIASPVSSNLNAAAYAGFYSAVGDGGAILISIDGITWTEAASSRKATANKLNGIGSGAGRTVAVGAGGTIISSTDGSNWTEAASSRTVTQKELFAVAFNGTVWIAVGAEGTVLTSTDATANTWTLIRSDPAFAALKGITVGTNAVTTTLVYVAVGASGALVTSPDAANWTQTAIGTNTLNAVTSVTKSLAQTCGTQFVAVGDGGTIFTSTDGTTWAKQPVPPAAGNLNAIVHTTFSYSAVGAAGVTLLAK